MKSTSFWQKLIVKNCIKGSFYNRCCRCCKWWWWFYIDVRSLRFQATFRSLIEVTVYKKNDFAFGFFFVFFLSNNGGVGGGDGDFGGFIIYASVFFPLIFGKLNIVWYSVFVYLFSFFRLCLNSRIIREFLFYFLFLFYLFIYFFAIIKVTAVYVVQLNRKCRLLFYAIGVWEESDEAVVWGQVNGKGTTYSIRNSVIREQPIMLLLFFFQIYQGKFFLHVSAKCFCYCFK